MIKRRENTWKVRGVRLLRKFFYAIETYCDPFYAIRNYMFPLLPSVYILTSPSAIKMYVIILNVRSWYCARVVVCRRGQQAEGHEIVN
jgi:hypothetical protein